MEHVENLRLHEKYTEAVNPYIRFQYVDFLKLQASSYPVADHIDQDT